MVTRVRTEAIFSLVYCKKCRHQTAGKKLTNCSRARFYNVFLKILVEILPKKQVRRRAARP
jgi:hypothetical protein